MKTVPQVLLAVTAVALCLFPCVEAHADDETLDVLFIGNSFTARHNLARVIELMAEAGQSGLKFEDSQVIYARTSSSRPVLSAKLSVGKPS